MATLSQFFEVRLKRKGQIISRHIDAKSQEQAVSYAGSGKVLSVKKVHAEDVIGVLNERDIKLGNSEALRVQGELELAKKNRKIVTDPIVMDMSLDSIVFSNGGKKVKVKENKSPYRGSENYGKEKERSNRKFGITDEI